QDSPCISVWVRSADGGLELKRVELCSAWTAEGGRPHVSLAGTKLPERSCTPPRNVLWQIVVPILPACQAHPESDPRSPRCAASSRPGCDVFLLALHR